MSNDSTIYIAPCGCGYQDGRTDRQTLACPAHLYAGSLVTPSRLMVKERDPMQRGVKSDPDDLRKITSLISEEQHEHWCGDRDNVACPRCAILDKAIASVNEVIALDRK